MDSCRGLAALSVLLYHLSGVDPDLRADAVGPLQDGLRMGVQIFFVLSGFLLYRPFVAARRGKGRQVAIKRYAWSRVLRIVPGYWFALTFLGIFASLPGVISDEWWRFYFFGQVYDERTTHMGMGVAWSLCVELTFYLILPLYAVLAAKWGRNRELAVLAGVGVLSFAFQCATLDVNWSGTLPGAFYWFIPGMVLAIFSVDRPERIEAIGAKGVACWTSALLVYVAACYSGIVLSDTAHPMLVNGLLPLVAILIVLPAMTEGGAVQWFLGRRTLLWLGTVSYGIYLYHATFMAYLTDHGGNDWLPGSPWLSLAFATVVPTVFMAACSWYFLEKPLLRLKSMRLPWRQRPVLASAGASASAGSPASE